MPTTTLEGDTLDDLMRSVFERIRSHGKLVSASRGENIEITGAALELSNPRSRLSKTEARGKPFSCLGELCWYLSGSDNPDFVSYYISYYKIFTKYGAVPGAYGPRLMNWKGINQIDNLARLLKEKPHSRQAVIQLFDAQDIGAMSTEVPCTCSLQFLLREDKLNLITYMRSNDAYVGLPHDFFSFTMVQEVIARRLGLEVGRYTHMVGSLHLYTKDSEKVDHFLSEGWQSTLSPMPPMPDVDPTEAIKTLLQVEEKIRTAQCFDNFDLPAVDSYWADLMLLLCAFRHRRDGKEELCASVQDRISSSSYSQYLYVQDPPR